MWNKFHWFRCTECGHRFRRKSPSGFFPCPKCESKDAFPEDALGLVRGVDVPQKGSPEWYKGRWFRRNEREWHDDIRSRVQLPNGKVVRNNG